MANDRHADLMKQGFAKPAKVPAANASKIDEAAWARRCAENTRAYFSRVGFD